MTVNVLTTCIHVHDIVGCATFTRRYTLFAMRLLFAYHRTRCEHM